MVALGIKLEPVLGVEVALGVGVVPGSLLVVDGGVGALMPVGVVPSALLLVDGIVGTLLLVDGVVGALMLLGVVPGALLLVETVAAVVVLAVRGAEKPVLNECDVDGWMEVALPIPDRQMIGAELMSWDGVFLPQR